MRRLGMCRKKIISVIFFFILLGIFAVIAKAQTVEVELLPEASQAILPNSGNFAVFGINANDDGDGDTHILSITVRFDQSPPGSDFTFNMTDISRVAIYEDGDSDGDGNGFFSSADTLLGEELGPLSSPLTITLLAPYALPNSDEDGAAGNDLFVVINTSNSIRDDDPSTTGNEGHAFTVTIPKGGIELDWYALVDPEQFPDADQTTETIYCEAWGDDITPISTYYGAPPSYYDYPGSGGDPTDGSRYPYSVPDEWIRPRYDNNPTSYRSVHRGHLPYSQLLPMEARTPVLGIDCGGGSTLGPNNSQRIILESVTVTFTALSPDFDPTTGLDPLRGCPCWSPFSGVALYKDTGGGVWDYETDEKVPVDFSGWQEDWPEWTLTLSPTTSGGEYIKTTWDDNDLSDYFIVIRADSGYRDESGGAGDYDPIKYGAAFTVSIKQGDVKFSYPPDSTCNPSQPYVTDVKPIKPVLEIHDLVHSLYNTQRIDATSPVTPVFGLNITDTTDTRVLAFNDGDVFKWVSVYLYDESGTTDTSAFMTLSANQNSGISLWKDNKTDGRAGVFDSQDTFILVAPPNWEEIVPGSVWKAQLNVANHQDVPGDDIYDADNKGDDYFVCIRTSATLSYADRFSFEIKDGDEYALDGLKLKAQLNAEGTGVRGNILTANFPVFLTDLTTPYQNIPANSSRTPVIGINTWDDTENGGALEQVIVEFYNPGGRDDVAFNAEDDLKHLSSGSSSGVAIYRDTNGNGVFDSAIDLVIPLKEWSWDEGVGGQPYDQCRLVFQDPEPIPANDTAGTSNSGADYFVVIKTAGSLGYQPGDDFSVGIVSWGPKGSVWGSRALGFIDQGDNQTRSYERIETNVVGNGVVAPPADDEGDTTIVEPEAEGSGGGGGSLEGCFIATACYGAPMAEEVKVLSQFRDEYLLTNSSGRIFVGAYYKISPQIASYISQHPLLRNLVRWTLKPIVKITDKFLNDDSSKVISRRGKQ
ncbi:hypothetical protein KAS42_01890 [bacterium]|nr:hypothetical protein [bacterium]